MAHIREAESFAGLTYRNGVPECHVLWALYLQAWVLFVASLRLKSVAAPQCSDDLLAVVVSSFVS